MDVLSDVLGAVKLRGALFYHGECSSPWSFFAPPSKTVALHVMRSAGHVIIYHLLTEGRASARLVNGERMSLAAGDIVVFPYGNAHILENGSAARTVDMSNELSRVFSAGLRLSKLGGGGEITRFVCGYLACDLQLSQVLLSGLPPVFEVTIGDDASGRWLENSIRFSADQACNSRAGGDAVLTKLSEVLFIETLRIYITHLPSDQRGWLAGTRDVTTGKALALMQRRPAHPWTLVTLSRQAGVSRSVLAERFRFYLGEGPIAYLTRWRLQLARQALASSTSSIRQIATEVGYESEAAFSRAFKRCTGISPASFRRDASKSRDSDQTGNC
jgi:AraC-like DNA-binding protein